MVAEGLPFVSVNVLSEEKQTTGHCAGATGLVAAAHRERNQSSARDGCGLSESRGHYDPASGGVGTPYTGKTGQRGVPRLCAGKFKTGQRGVPRLGTGGFKTGQ